jgi:hypothetical protein
MPVRTFPAFVLIAITSSLCAQQADASGGVTTARSLLTYAELTTGPQPKGLVPNTAFLPATDAAGPTQPFSGELLIPEFELQSNPARIADGLVMNKDPQRFPAVRLGFVSADGELLPTIRDIQLTAAGRSYWDIIVDPGRVWSEPGDRGMSRASFPFVLMNRLEGESHNGVATFLYDRERVSGLVLQVMQQTAPYYLQQHFSAWGYTPVRYDARAVPERDTVVALRQRERAARLPMADLTEFARVHPGVKLERFDGQGVADDVVISGILDAGTIYTAGCRTEAGVFPYCESMRHGVWSITKSLVPAVALLRLAQKYGPQVYAERIADHLRVTGHAAEWSRVTFLDAANMATGIGSGSTATDPNDISDGYLAEVSGYDAWYRAPTLAERLAITFRESAYPWGPGRVARYRDQDPLVLMAAMDHYLKAREGAQASVWQMLMKEVFEPIGIVHLPQARVGTIPGETGLPIGSYGLYPTVADTLRVAQLLQKGGVHDGVQVLSAAGIAQSAGPATPAQFRSGEVTAAGEVIYAHYFWNVPFRDQACVANIPSMMGWGGNVVALLPNGMTAFRISRGREKWDPTDMAVAAHRARSFCAGSP